MHGPEAADRGEQAQRAAAGGDEQRAIGGGELRHVGAAHVLDHQDPRLLRIVEGRGHAARACIRAGAARRCAPRPRASRRRRSPVPSVSVAEVTSTPCAGSTTDAANGTVGSTQWRCRPTSVSRPSIRSTDEPVDEFGRRLARHGAEHGAPGAELVEPAPREAAHQRFDADARGGVERRRPRPPASSPAASTAA